MVGPASIAIIAGVAVIIFGPKKLPELGRAMGSTLREFKSATKGLTDEDFESTKQKTVETNSANEVKAVEKIEETK
ncbi:MAG: twin-arginine translocase TatA/TatE family subunit [Kurthia gibsonii]|uniref:Sec-independent protein translocase protein TatA n=1 Tax=Kurthia gibsonii TaxID=33946 RepID=A0ABU9LQI8_9BACL|nr:MULTISPECIES: twin-arginine translocase TatA/TatE family subunit [Kurthia]MCA9724787.1 twin-arginine translocase TatA/TatE family subunit [Kurthia sp.]AMA64384.1 sec-independent translocase tatAy domain protein [Kurthia sp. 11kri321]MEB6114041.1 twin-arginine translocase TatA/TatE family subunit [Kurthia gibsonii]MEB7773631.1 twin-arginine translocase TatA/TatE family subunit [Kurthia gibsonii]RXH50954.1 twin-arginine translocase TatA/TatE family subunit [Kurthia gibsonii]